MKNLLALVGLAVVLVAGAGWYLGWYQVKTQPTAGGHRTIDIDVDTNKIKNAIKNGEDKVSNVVTNASNNQHSGNVPLTPTSFPSLPPISPLPPPPAPSPNGGVTITPGSVSVTLPPPPSR